MKTPQDKLNEIDALLYKAGFSETTTINKVEEIIKDHNLQKCRSEHRKGVIEDAIVELKNGL